MTTSFVRLAKEWNGRPKIEGSTNFSSTAKPAVFSALEPSLKCL